MIPLFKKILSLFYKSAFLILFSFLFAFQSQAQLPSGDLSRLNVDQLTAIQVQTIFGNYQSSGMTEDQFYTSLSQRGLPGPEINKLFTRMSQLQGKSGSSLSGKDDTRNLRNTLSMGNKSGASVDVNLDKLDPTEKKLFGYRIFHNADINFTPNISMATPKNYVVGPKDGLVIQVYGVAQSTYNLIVSPEGRITIPEVGVAQVGGFTIEAVQSLLQEKLSIRYAGMRGANPNTFLQVTVSNIRTIKVNMVGEIYKAGTYTLPSYVNVFNALFAAGGPTVKGSFRSVQVFRNNKQVADIDLYDFIVNGKISQNIRLEDNDVVLVPPTSGRVEISGEIRIPGIFEFKSKESFQEVLKYTGGFTDNAYKQLVYVRRRGLTENLVLDLPASKFSMAVLNDGDSIVVGEILNKFSNRVQVSGAVNRPGAFELTKGMKVQDLLQKAGGLKGDAYMKRATLYRTRPDFSQELVTIDLLKISDPNDLNNIELQKEDVLSIASVYDLKEEFYVQITGEINNPGVFPYADSMSLADLLLKAGSFKYSASGSYLEIARRKLNEDSKIAEVITVNIDKDLSTSANGQKILLQPFDHIYVRAIPGFQPAKIVTIKGEVKYAGEYVIDRKEMRISDLLVRAGGITKYAYTKGATLIRRTKNYKPKTIAEQQNEKLISLKDNLQKDGVLVSSENNQELTKRIDNKITQNSLTINDEKELKEKELQKQGLLKDNAALKGKNAVIQEEKEQELVAIDFDEIMKHPGSATDILLKDGDELDIPEQLETVSVKGGVLYPVSVRYEPGLHFNEYINRSGGYVPQAMRSRSYVLQANGKVERVKHFLFFKSYPKIEPGAQVFVPIDTSEKPPFTYEKGLGIITSALTLIFLLRTL